MRLKGSIEGSIEHLIGFGFREITPDYVSDDPSLEYQEGYAYDLGESRRGQSYYLICSTDGVFSLFSSEPDGSGGKIDLTEDSVFSRLYASGLVS